MHILCGTPHSSPEKRILIWLKAVGAPKAHKTSMSPLSTMPFSRLRSGITCMSQVRMASGASLAVDPAQSYDRLKKLLRQVSALAEVEGILTYDEQVFMPPGAAKSRSDQKAALAKVVHEMRTGADMREAINGVRGTEDEFSDPRARANIRDAVEAFDKEARKSSELAEREARLESEAFAAWQQARKESNFSLFAEKLREIFELKKEVAAVTRLGAASGAFHACFGSATSRS